ncbi:ECF transporter S component [Alicyclobacillus sp. SO9]|uniref:ECF transporter S component n=1 Tax=Alicyclobacillus sp. SO9 TaxID=2665646 RepID=UPI0018E865AC|nr:ECF transporter S component [Alicyclobacillus sp. SO9]
MSSMLPKSWQGTATLHLPFAGGLFVYILIWLLCLTLLYFVIRGARSSSSFMKWTTQDILIVAIMGVILEVYDNMIGDQFVTPIIRNIPFAHIFAANDLPYMFLLMVGIAIVRKPGAATAMVFVDFLIMQLLYGGSESTPLYWPYGLAQGLFIDLYFLSRQGSVFASGGFRNFWDGLVMGALRAIPAVTIQSLFMGPFLNGQTETVALVFWYSLFNAIGNGLEAGITAPLAIRVARAVGLYSGTVASDGSLLNAGRDAL